MFFRSFFDLVFRSVLGSILGSKMVKKSIPNSTKNSFGKWLSFWASLSGEKDAKTIEIESHCWREHDFGGEKKTFFCQICRKRPSNGALNGAKKAPGIASQMHTEIEIQNVSKMIPFWSKLFKGFPLFLYYFRNWSKKSERVLKYSKMVQKMLRKVYEIVRK